MITPPTERDPLKLLDLEEQGNRRFRLVFCLPLVLGLLLAALLSIRFPGSLYSVFHDRPLRSGESSISLGLDLKGGARITYHAIRETYMTEERFAHLLRDVQGLLRDRVSTFGNLEPNIWIDNSGYVFLELPGVDNRASIEKIVGKTGRLDFIVLAEGTGDRVRAGSKLAQEDNGEIVASKEDVEKFSLGIDPNGKTYFAIDFVGDRANEIQQKFAKHHGRWLALALSGEIQEVVRISDDYGRQVGKGGKRTNITSQGGLTEEQAAAYQQLFRWDSLPLELEERERQLIGPQTGSESLSSVRIAALLGGTAIMMLMILMYGTYLGATACVALIYGGLLMWGVLSAFGTVLTLSGVAGLLLDLGVFVDSFIIIFEGVKDRIRERIEKKLDGFDEETVWDSIRHSAKHLTSLRITALISGFVLFLSPGPVRAFAVFLIVGVLIETLVASRVVLGALLLLFSSHGQNVTRGTYGRPIFRGQGTVRTISWTLRRLPWVAGGSVIFALLLFAYAVFRPPPLGLELGGGTQIRIDLPRTVDEGTLRKALRQGGGTDLLSVQSVIPVDRGKTRPWLLAFRAEPDAAKIEQRVKYALAGSGLDVTVSDVWHVAPGVPAHLLGRWLFYCGLALLAVVVWCATPLSGVSIEGRRLAPALVVGLGAIHDLFIIAGVVAVLRLPIDTPMLMGGLFILGYAVNDSLVLIWHLGEGSGHVGRRQKTVQEVILGIRSRTFNIFFLMLSAILPVLLLAGGAFRGYGAVVVTGLVVGSLTSVYVAGYLLDLLLRRKSPAGEREISKQAVSI